MKTLNQLPKQTQKVFIMSRFENKSGKEIAQILGISVKGVDYHMNKALKRTSYCSQRLPSCLNLALFDGTYQ